MDEDTLNELKRKTSLAVFPLTSAAKTLLDSIGEAIPSPATVRNIIRNYQLPTNEVFDTIAHADVNFIETVGLYL
jgi:hypothetical protein